MAATETPNIQKITGVGLAFPLKLENGKAKLTTGFSLIEQAIGNIISYEYGDRFFLYEFGLRLRALLEDPLDDVTESALEGQFELELPRWERRCKVDSVNIKRLNDLGRVNIIVSVSLKNTSLSETFVFPYYKEIIY